MLTRTIEISLQHRGLVCVLALLLVFLGGQALRQLPIDAFPDTTPVQVQINTTVPALGPLEAEQQVTLPVELALGGLSGLQNLRSISKFGLSQVVATFDDGTDIYRARQLVAERMQSVELPEGITRRQLGPIATGLGEVFHYAVRATDPARPLADLRELQDWVIAPHLRQVRGVAEINAWGGYEKHYHVVADPERLIALQVTLAELVRVLQDNNQNVGGGQIVRGGEALLVHGVGLATTTEELGNIVIDAHQGVPVRVRDVARVQVDHEIRRGAVTAEGRGETVLGLGFMLMGENSAQVTRALKAKLAEVQPSLPPDVVVETLYDRTELVEQVIDTVEHNLLFGALLVIAVLFAFLGDLRAGLIVAAAIPLSMLCAGSFMLQTGIAASLLSLGAIDFGLIVDSSVIMVENCARHLRESDGTRSRLAVVRAAALEVRKPTMFGELIIILVFLPVLTLEGIEGKLFRPMALTMVFALAGSMVLSLTLMPVLAGLFLPAKVRQREPLLMRLLRRVYTPVLHGALRWRKLTLGLALLVVAAAGLLASRMGGEFVPRLGEQALAVNTVRLAGISVEEAVALNDRLERELLARFPDEIAHIWTRLGTAQIATDPMGIELTDFFIALKPRDQWQKARTQAELVEAMRQVFAVVPGMTTAFSQPIEMRMNEMIAGVRGEVAVKILGDDFDELGRLAGQIQQVLAGIPATAEVTGEQVAGQPVLKVRVDPEAIARHGISTRQVLDVVEAVGARQVGEVRQGQRRFPLVVRLPDRQRTDPQAQAATLIPTAGGAVLPLGQVATLSLTEGPTTINREWGRRRVTVQADVRGGDLAGYATEARWCCPKAMCWRGAGNSKTWSGPMPGCGWWCRSPWGPDRRPAVPDLRTGSRCPAGLHWGAAGDGRRGAGPVAGGPALLGVGGHRLPRPVGHLGAGRHGAGLPGAPAARSGGGIGRSGHRGRPDPAAAGADDRPGGLYGFCAHGLQHRGRLRGAAPPGHGGHRRGAQQHPAHPGGAAGALSGGGPQGTAGLSPLREACPVARPARQRDRAPAPVRPGCRRRPPPAVPG